MSELLRTTVFGQLVRALTNKRLLKYEEEYNPVLALSYQNKSTNPACNQSDEHELADQSDISEKSSNESLSSSTRGAPEGPPSISDAVRGLRGDAHLDCSKDPEKPKDPNLVDWYGPDDSGMLQIFSSCLTRMIADDPFREPIELVYR